MPVNSDAAISIELDVAIPATFMGAVYRIDPCALVISATRELFRAV
jgi:hypothetical protein